MRGGLSRNWQRLLMDNDAHTRTLTRFVRGGGTTKMESLSFQSGLSSSSPFLVVLIAWVLGTGKQDLYCTGKALSVQKRRQARGGISSATQTGEGLADHVTSASHPLTLYTNVEKTPKQINLQPTHHLKCALIKQAESSSDFFCFCAPQSSPLEKNPSQTNSGLHQGFPQTSAHSSTLFYPMCHSFACRHSPTDMYSSVIKTFR